MTSCTSPRFGAARIPILAMLLALAAFALAACGGDDAEGEPTPAALASASALSSAAAASPTATPAPEKRTITDATGAKIEVPWAPKRVVTLTDHDLDSALALGVKPIGVAAGRAGAGSAGAPAPPAFLADRLAGVPVIAGTEVDFEAVAALRPDIILAGQGQSATPEAVATLSKIAPTVVTNLQPQGWKENFAGVADALNLGEKGKEVTASYDARVARVRTALGARLGNSVSIVRWNPQGPAFMLHDHFASLVIRDVGLVRPESQRAPGASPSLVSLEQMQLLDADWMFLGVLVGPAQDALDKAKQMPVYQSLNVVKNNRVIPIDGSVWTSRGGPLAADFVLSDIEKAMAAAR